MVSQDPAIRHTGLECLFAAVMVGSNQRLRASAVGAILMSMVLVGIAQAQTVLTSCGTISSPGSYVLGNDITASGICFTITTGGVGIDLRGHTLTGNGTGSGIVVGNGSNIVITNGTITNFGQGVQMSSNSSRNETIDRLNVSGNTGEGISIGGCCNTLTNIKANNTGNIGIVIVGPNNSLNTIQADGNGSYGVLLQGGLSSGTLIEASGNGGYGIEVSTCCNSVGQTTATNNGFAGIHEVGGQSVVANSIASGNLGNGVDLTASDATGAVPGHNLVTNTIANGNGRDGIGETGSNSAANEDVVANSTANQNKGRGIYVICPSNTLRDTALNNQGGNLVEVTSSGACTNLDNNAP